MKDLPAAYAAAPRWPFGDSPELADELLTLVLAGGKRATCSSLASCEADIMPTVGEVSVILDGAGVPRCAIRTTEVEIMPFEQVSEDFARAEGRAT
ncbi:ASCH domain-containing protein [Brevundimonas sp. LF-1]|uniref:ASCH domain-containing protein n=1 Tax=Brevundimonas sp. LF-1 TaxID=3126100 RepID=UPI0030E035A7